MYSFNKLCSNVIPAGTYKAEITEIKFKTSSTGEALNDLAIKYTILEGTYAKRVVAETISEKAFSFKLKPFLTACNIDMNREFNTARELYEYGIKSAKGKVINIDVVVSPYNGVDYNNVKGYSPLPSSTTSVEDVMAEFNTPMEAVSEKPTLQDVPVLDEIEAPIANVSDDDLPF